jgi:hypothetical protein
MQNIRQFSSKGSVLIPVIIVILILLGIAAYFIIPQYKSTSSQPSQTTTSATPTSPITDFAPNFLPADQKSTIVIRTSDSSTVTYLVAKDQVETFIKKLPAGDEVVSKSP